MLSESKLSHLGVLELQKCIVRVMDKVPEMLIKVNVINLRKRTMPDIITPLYRVKIFGIVLDMKSS